LYQQCPFKTFYSLYNISKVSETSKLQLQTRPTFAAIALYEDKSSTFARGYGVGRNLRNLERGGANPPNPLFVHNLSGKRYAKMHGQNQVQAPDLTGFLFLLRSTAVGVQVPG